MGAFVCVCVCVGEVLMSIVSVLNYLRKGGSEGRNEGERGKRVKEWGCEEMREGGGRR